MEPWRKVLAKKKEPTVWTLYLECGHVAYRSAQYSRQEFPSQALCDGWVSLIGSQVKSQRGTLGTVASYHDGMFDVAWQDSGATRWTLDELREEAEIL